MGRAPCCDKQGLKKGPWTPEEDKILVDYIQSHGHGIWRSLPKQAGLLRCGKSCRLRWINYLRPDIKRGPFTPEEHNSIVHLHGVVGNKWSIIAAQLPGRTDNEVKNYWNTHLKKRLLRREAKPESRCRISPASSARSDGGCSGAFPAFSSVPRHMAQWESAGLEAEARLAGETLLPSHLRTAAASMAQPDVFLRIWHSEVGEAFRSGDGATSTGASPASSSTMHAVSTPKQCRVAGPGAASVEAKEDGDCKSLVSGGGGGGNGNAEAAGFCVAGAHSPRSSERMYQMYLNWVGEDMALGGLYFQETFGSFSWLGGGDLGEETCLDTAFQ